MCVTSGHSTVRGECVYVTSGHSTVRGECVCVTSIVFSSVTGLFHVPHSRVQFDTSSCAVAISPEYVNH